MLWGKSLIRQKRYKAALKVYEEILKILAFQIKVLGNAVLLSEYRHSPKAKLEECGDILTIVLLCFAHCYEMRGDIQRTISCLKTSRFIAKRTQDWDSELLEIVTNKILKTNQKYAKDYNQYKTFIKILEFFYKKLELSFLEKNALGLDEDEDSKEMRKKQMARDIMDEIYRKKDYDKVMRMLRRVVVVRREDEDRSYSAEPGEKDMVGRGGKILSEVRFG